MTALEKLRRLKEIEQEPIAEAELHIRGYVKQKCEGCAGTGWIRTQFSNHVCGSCEGDGEEWICIK